MKYRKGTKTYTHDGLSLCLEDWRKKLHVGHRALKRYIDRYGDDAISRIVSDRNNEKENYERTMARLTDIMDDLELRLKKLQYSENADTLLDCLRDMRGIIR